VPWNVQIYGLDGNIYVSRSPVWANFYDYAMSPSGNFILIDGIFYNRDLEQIYIVPTLCNSEKVLFAPDDRHVLIPAMMWKDGKVGPGGDAGYRLYLIWIDLKEKACTSLFTDLPYSVWRKCLIAKDTKAAICDKHVFRFSKFSDCK